MTTPLEFQNIAVPVKFFLVSHRALTDGKLGIYYLENHLKSASFLLSDWKVIWIGVCSILRVAVDLFQVDSRSCINEKIRREIGREWKLISANRQDHPIFWEFLRKERNNILHQYEWSAYEAWMKADGTLDISNRGILSLKSDDATPVLLMRGGHYDGQNSMDLLRESAEWLEQRIFGAIRRAGFDPEESRKIGTFELAPSTMAPATLLAGGFE